MFNPLEYPIIYSRPLRMTPETPAWIDNIPFAFFLMEIHRPKTLVELGTYTGTSYCAFCQAVESLRLGTRCYAVDHWQGDEQQGFYGEQIFQDLSDYNELMYGHFSRLLRMDFDEALQYFPDKSIDALHIDGLHYYENVKKDFESWLPKMSDRGLILLHDTNGKEKGMGVGKFLEELRSSYPVFEFIHGYGLGVVGVGNDLPQNKVWDFLQASPDEIFEIRNFFGSLGSGLVNTWKLTNRLHEYKKFAEMQELLKARDEEIRYKDTQILERNSEIAFRDSGIVFRDSEIVFRDKLIAKLEALVFEKDLRIKEMESRLEQE